ncbi:hypothetical protein AB0M36_25030 [Actinoplanes sp. NPDC051346]
MVVVVMFMVDLACAIRGQLQLGQDQFIELVLIQLADQGSVV